MGIFLNVDSKTSVLAQQHIEISGNWVAMSFTRLHREQRAWENGAHA